MKLLLTSFDSGYYKLPLMVALTPQGDTIYLDSPFLDVTNTPVDTANFVMHPIKGQMRYPVTFREVLPWIGLGLGIAALIALAVWLIIRYRRRHGEEAQKKDPAHIVALRKLDNYRGSKMWAPEKQKAFYSGITDTLREYIDARYDIGAMEMTTAEIVKDMKKTDVPADLQDGLKDLFERADFVKFAKFTASDEDNAAALPFAVRFVTSTYQMDIDDSSAAAPQDEVKAAQDDKKGGE